MKLPTRSPNETYARLSGPAKWSLYAASENVRQNYGMQFVTCDTQVDAAEQWLTYSTWMLHVQYRHNQYMCLCLVESLMGLRSRLKQGSTNNNIHIKSYQQTESTGSLFSESKHLWALSIILTTGETIRVTAGWGKCDHYYTDCC